MAGYGSWEDRPWGVRREGGQERDRWRREQEMGARREGERWRERDEERLGRRGREEWRAEDDPERREGWRPEWRVSEEERRPGGGRGPMHGPWRGEGDWERERSTHAGRYGAPGAFPAYGPRGEERFMGRRLEERDWRGAGEEQEWRGGERGWRGEPRGRETERPWVDPGAERTGRDTRGMVEWEDRGPLAWLRARFGGGPERRARGPKGYSRSDDRIHEDVCERIARSGVDAGEVEVKVENREVTLTGTVGDRDEKWWLEQVVDDVFGVEEVHNHLRIHRGERGRTEGTDPAVRH
jgi:hypothetical protein